MSRTGYNLPTGCSNYDIPGFNGILACGFQPCCGDAEFVISAVCANSECRKVYTLEAFWNAADLSIDPAERFSCSCGEEDFIRTGEHCENCGSDV